MNSSSNSRPQRQHLLQENVWERQGRAALLIEYLHIKDVGCELVKIVGYEEQKLEVENAYQAVIHGKKKKRKKKSILLWESLSGQCVHLQGVLGRQKIQPEVGLLV